MTANTLQHSLLTLEHFNWHYATSFRRHISMPRQTHTLASSKVADNLIHPWWITSCILILDQHQIHLQDFIHHRNLFFGHNLLANILAILDSITPSSPRVNCNFHYKSCWAPVHCRSMTSPHKLSKEILFSLSLKYFNFQLFSADAFTLASSL